MPDKTLQWLAALTVLVSFCAGLGLAPLFDKDEGAFAEATREMVVSGDYLMTYLNGAPRYDKPILIYWLQALCVHLFGLSEFSVRLPSGIAAVVWAWLLWRFVRERDGTRTAAWAVFILATAIQVTLIAKAAIADALLNACIAGTMFGFWKYHETASKKALYGAFTAMALGALTKGPIALYVPFATLLVFGWRRGCFRASAKTLFHPGGWALFLAITLPWPILAYLDQGWPLIQAWIFDQTIRRVGGPLEGHGGNIFYYLPVILLGLMPWTPLFLKQLRRIRPACENELNQYLWIWLLSVFILFSLMGTKLPHYMIYGYTPVCILMARLLSEQQSVRPMLLAGAVLCVLFLTVPLLIPVAVPMSKSEFAVRLIDESMALFDWRYSLPFAGGLLIFAALLALPRLRSDYKAIALGWVFLALVNFHIMPFAGKITQEPIREAALLAKRENLPVVKWKLNMPSFYFYRESLIEERLAAPGEIIFTRIDELESIYEQYDVLYYDKGVVLAKVLKVRGL
ncbi:MAG: glycosyltransferase family 39 protein [Candidatus Hydrogenedens sp.]|nr:glycosyltransferase family 39 protein [Candidatus Hydrogenedens sp.]